MVSRRLLRIKVLQAYYSWTQKSGISLKQSVSELDTSVSKSLDLFFFLLMLLIDLRDYTHGKNELASQKFIPSDDEIDKSERFVKNQVLEIIENNVQLSAYLNSAHYSWKSHQEILKTLWSKLKQDQVYRKYALNNEPSFNEDKELIIYIVNNYFISCDELEEVIEEKSIYWNDDFEFILSIINSTIRKLRKDSKPEIRLVSLYRDDDDRIFAQKLLEFAIINNESFDQTITKYIKNWELDRIAVLDRLIMHLAMVEFCHMPHIPIKVTINEYLDIAKCYSTHKSSVFINGVLDKIYLELKETDKLNKSGRGLLEKS